MKNTMLSQAIALLVTATGFNLLAADASSASSPASDAPPKVPGFSVDYMDRSVSPGYEFLSNSPTDNG